MTVSYQYEVASSTSGGFTRLLFMWRGSLYKLIYRELLLFLGGFLILSALYRNVFTDSQKRLFEKVVVYCDTFINLIPLSFVLGFYVSYVAGRWWQQYTAIPWPDKLMHCIALYVDGNDDHGRILRRTLMRYLNLSLILVLRSISSAVKRRLPTLDHVVESGFMTTTELEMYQSVPSVEFNTYWIPCTWFIGLLKNAKKNSRITDNQGLKIIMEEFNEFRSKCGMLWSYDWVSIPLVYTQVVTLATYCFFLAALVGRQYVETSKKPYQMEVDVYIPVFTILQFFFFMGLLKVAEQLINPFGDDDEDFELNWLIDRHTKVSYLGVDTLMMRYPPLVKDKYFDQDNLVLPYTEASVPYKKKTYRGSVHNMSVPEEKHGMFLPEIAEEDEERESRSESTVNLQEGISCSRPKGSKFKSQLDFTAPFGSVTTLHSPEEGNQDNKSIFSDSHRDLPELRYKTLLTRSESSASRKAQYPSWASTSTLDTNFNISQLSIPSPSLMPKSSFKPFSEEISPRHKGSKLTGKRMKGVWPVHLRKAKPVVWRPMGRPLPQRTYSNVSTDTKPRSSKDPIDLTKVKPLRLTQSAPSLFKSRVKKLSSDSFFNRFRKFKKKQTSITKYDKIRSDSISLRRSISLPNMFLKSYSVDKIIIQDIPQTKPEEKDDSESKHFDITDQVIQEKKIIIQDISQTKPEEKDESKDFKITDIATIQENNSLSQQLDSNAKVTNDKVNEILVKEKDKHPTDSSLSSFNKNIDSQNEKVLDRGQSTSEQTQNSDSHSLKETLIEKLSCKDSKENITELYSSIKDLRDKTSESNLHKSSIESSKEDLKGSKMSLQDSTKEKLNESWESADWTKLLDTDNIRGDELRDMPSVLVHYSECPTVEDDGELKEVLVHKDTLKRT